ncbi:TMV resistance protein N-like [Daucus carota subsp. sativus]|uniref:TMV resistance protein N-like n=1 Tax=Daucus carota subsp. sativus TaxID=79200 RepID=UPI003083E7CB
MELFALQHSKLNTSHYIPYPTFFFLLIFRQFVDCLMPLLSMDRLLKQATSLVFPSLFPTSPRNYNVFLSFRGEDTRKSFTDHLYNALKLAGLQVFIDNTGLPRGKEISPGLIKAIQEAKVCIVIFSKNYASSRWCLDELLEILDCKKKLGLIVLPVFYKVDPSFIRHQKVHFEEALDTHKWFGKCFYGDHQTKKEKIEMWRAALHEAANISGYCPDNDANGHEATTIEKIVEDVLHVVDPDKHLKYSKIMGEIKTRLSFMNIENNVHVNGIMGITTKTIVSSGIARTVANAVANPQGILVEAATAAVARVVADKVLDTLNF